jgi:hypothetical protein
MAAAMTTETVIHLARRVLPGGCTLITSTVCSYPRSVLTLVLFLPSFCSYPRSSYPRSVLTLVFGFAIGLWPMEGILRQGQQDDKGPDVGREFTPDRERHRLRTRRSSGLRRVQTDDFEGVDAPC